MFATKEKVKALEPGITGSNRQAENTLDVVVDGVNSRIASYLNRNLLQTEATETIDITTQMSRLITLHNYPAQSISSLVVNGNTLTSDDYDLNKSTGQLYLKCGLYPQFGGISVTYTGGMAATEELLRSSYADITYEANKQALFEFRRMKTIEAKSKDLGGDRSGSQEEYREFDFVPSLIKVLDRYKADNCNVF